ncbi:Tensin-3, partial [Camelus dromedarius]
MSALETFIPEPATCPKMHSVCQSVVGKKSGPGAPDEGSRVAMGQGADAKAGPVRQGAQEGLSCCFGRWQEYPHRAVTYLHLGLHPASLLGTGLLGHVRLLASSGALKYLKLPPRPSPGVAVGEAGRGPRCAHTHTSFPPAAIAMLKDKEPRAFIVRDSHSFRGAYGLAMKVATPPPSVLQLNKKAGDLANELVRHFLIECTPKGVRLKGCPNEPYFGSLTALVCQHSITPLALPCKLLIPDRAGDLANELVRHFLIECTPKGVQLKGCPNELYFGSLTDLVCQHSITPLALPCKLLIPDRDPLEETAESSPQTAANSATELLKQGAGGSLLRPPRLPVLGTAGLLSSPWALG